MIVVIKCIMENELTIYSANGRTVGAQSKGLYVKMYITNVIHDGLSIFGRSYLRRAEPILDTGVSTVDGAWCTMVRTTRGSQQQLTLIEILGKHSQMTSRLSRIRRQLLCITLLIVPFAVQ
jgi:hypothetical protein